MDGGDDENTDGTSIVGYCYRRLRSEANVARVAEASLLLTITL